MKYARDVAVAAYAALEAEQEAAAAAEEREAILNVADIAGGAMDVDESDLSEYELAADPFAHSDTDLLTINDDDFTRLEDHQAYHSDDDFVPAGKKASKVCTRI
jgi:hypothetical protein